MRTVSVVVPVYNEEESLPELHRQLAQTASAAPGRWEFILVDDGSRDGSWETIKELHQKDPRVRGLRMRRNFGQTPAMSCGIQAAHGDVIITMDSDLQNDPADMPKLLEKIDEGSDVVCGWRYQRQDKLLSRKIPSMIANRLIGWLNGVMLHDYGCSLKAYRADVIKRTPLYADFHRFITALVTTTGANVTEIKVNHRARKFGKSKYNLSRTWRVAMDMITVSVLVKFSEKPLRLFGILALIFGIAGMACLFRTWHWYLETLDDITQILPGITLLSCWMSAHLFVVGLLAELCLATAHARPGRMIAAVEARRAA